ncbi:MAG: histidine kinase [Chitinophagales bacterium]|nr:histidine kinase [Chitinophagales bacterium]
MIHLTDYTDQRISNWTRNTRLYHVVFWILLFLIIFFANIKLGYFYESIVVSFIAVFFYAVIAYADFFFLFPKYIKDRNIVIHLIGLSFIALIVTPIRTLILFLFAQGNPDAQIGYVSNQLYVFFTHFIAGLYTTIYLIIMDWLQQQREKKELENQTLQSELRFLKSQINPHFLFNTLNSLYALTLKKSDLAPEIVLKLSEMMRYMLYDCNEKAVDLSKEITYMQNYLELEKLRHGDKVNIHLDIQGDADKNKIAPLLLIPFLENAFKHGIKDATSPGFVNMDIQILDRQLMMKIENSRLPSIPKSIDKRTGGIGLINVKRRMDILYPNHHSLNIQETPNTYLVELHLNLNNNIEF